jgi:hypothetical protein
MREGGGFKTQSLDIFGDRDFGRHGRPRGWRGGVEGEETETYSVNLLQKLSELAGDVGGVTVENGSVTGTDLTRVVQDDDLGIERSGLHSGVVLGA